VALIRAQSLTVAFGAVPVLDRINFAIQENSRTALVGRNGEGKSTLLKVIGGYIDADSGELSRRSSLKTAYLQQTVPTTMTGDVYACVASGLPEAGDLLAEFHKLSTDTENFDADKLQRVQDKIEAADAWALGQRVEETISRMSLNGDTNVAGLSGGMKRRVLLASAIVSDPDILLLDEPTNHLDIGSIDWLEQYLIGLNCSVVFVTHDRAFLNSVANNIIELDRGQLTHWPGNYEKYQTMKQQALDVEAEHNAQFDKKLAQEEAWIRQGIKARRTRNEGRVRALEAMREQHRERRNRSGSAKMSVNAADRSGKVVFETDNISFAFDDNIIVSNLSVSILRNDRLGIIGPNGCGKSTLINLLLGKLEPQQGAIKLGTQLEIAYFDQLRTALDPNLSAADNVSEGQDTLQINGVQKHIMSYMQDFLFAPDRARAPITALSGGETNRLLLAKLFLKPSNVLVLDEPSNDLDVETLELLESLLSEYKGTVILISHDRKLLDNVVTRSLVHQGNGKFVDVVGGYTDFLRELKNSTTLRPIFGDDEHLAAKKAKANSSTASSTPTAATSATNKPAKKLSYKVQKELDELPDLINQLEEKLAGLHSAIATPTFYDDKAKADTVLADADAVQAQLDAAYKRWEELEA